MEVVLVLPAPNSQRQSSARYLLSLESRRDGPLDANAMAATLATPAPVDYGNGARGDRCAHPAPTGAAFDGGVSELAVGSSATGHQGSRERVLPDNDFTARWCH